MTELNPYINENVCSYLRHVIDRYTFSEINEVIRKYCGIYDFFVNDTDLVYIKMLITNRLNYTQDRNKSEYGDFQTNMELARQVCLQVDNQNEIKVLIEPTCGKGNFILAALNCYKNLDSIYGIEVHEPYIWEVKFNILDHFLNQNVRPNTHIHIIHSNVFDYDFSVIRNQAKDDQILIVGNPPWVTNSGLGKIESQNLPKKLNLNRVSGIEALTGKGNFDIAENIVIKLIETFRGSNTTIALLVKNSVIKNLVFYQSKKKYPLSSISKFNIDSKKEFGVSVESSLFLAKLNLHSIQLCDEYDFYNKKKIRTFGWENEKFISDLDRYNDDIDGESQIEWRQGIKHDCSDIMDMNKIGSYYSNSKNEVFELEDDLVYGFLKSSDLKKGIINTVRKYTIVTQSFIGQDTNYLADDYPLTYNYLDRNRVRFNSRKSSIYKGRAPFSIFGVGDYSFKPYKVAIAGLYKKPEFALVMPIDGKPVMLDDTCYFIGFDLFEYAVYSYVLLNSSITRDFLSSIVFLDAKRPYTKDVLMRIDLLSIADSICISELDAGIQEVTSSGLATVDLCKWDEFLQSIRQLSKSQLALF